MQLRYTHTRLLVKDFPACFRFYRDVLGFTPTWGSEDDIYADFDTGTPVSLALFNHNLMQSALEQRAGAAYEAPVDPVCLIFSVEDVDAAFERLAARGAPVAAGPVDHPEWGIRTAHFRDPDGNLIEINHDIPMENGQAEGN